MSRRGRFTVLILYFGMDLMLCRFLLFPLMQKGMKPLAYEASCVLIHLCLMIFMGGVSFMFLEEQWDVLCAHRKECLKFLILCVLSVFLIQLAAGALCSHTSANQAAADAMKQNALFRCLFETIVYGPFAEELVFRESIYGLCREKLNRTPAAFISCALFGLGHVLFIQKSAFLFFWAVYSLCGYALLACREKSGSLFTSILAHMSVNLIVFLIQGLWTKIQ